MTTKTLYCAASLCLLLAACSGPQEPQDVLAFESASVAVADSDAGVDVATRADVLVAQSVYAQLGVDVLIAGADVVCLRLSIVLPFGELVYAPPTEANETDECKAWLDVEP
jgi:hypothetical protein